jgi:hypothetical protein
MVAVILRSPQLFGQSATGATKVAPAEADKLRLLVESARIRLALYARSPFRGQPVGHPHPASSNRGGLYENAAATAAALPPRPPESRRGMARGRTADRRRRQGHADERPMLVRRRVRTARAEDYAPALPFYRSWVVLS